MNFKYDVTWRSSLPQLHCKEEEIINLHLTDKISISQLSKIYNCDRKPIQNILLKNGYSTRSSASSKLDGYEDEILQMYVSEKLTIQTIRKKIGCSYSAIQNFLKRQSIKLRTAEESRKTNDGKVKCVSRRLTTDEDIIDAIAMYNAGEVLETIGKKYNITPSGLRSKFIKLGVPMRTLTESANLSSTHSRKKQTYMDRYGVENPMQNPVIYETSNINRYKFKAVDIHGRRFSHLQGFEPQGITYLIENMDIDVNHIQTGRKVPTIKYKFEGKNKTYYPDIYVCSKNLLVEIKCEYTYNNMLELNQAKRSAAIDAGYDYLTIIFDNSGKAIKEIF